MSGWSTSCPAHAFPRATDHIPEMVALAERLEDLGHAYASELGNVYYAVGTFEGYGQLSRNTLDELRAGHRGDIEPDKRDPADFALWKAAGAHRVLRWPTERWGDGFPGWHLECSAMALRYLGERFDIHTGGVDNIFPHHEDEIAQSAPVVGGPPADLWVHGAAPAHGRPEDGQVGGQFPADHGARRRGVRSAGLPLPRPDLALRPDARLLRCVAGRRPLAAWHRCAPASSPSGRHRPMDHGRRRPAVRRRRRRRPTCTASSPADPAGPDRAHAPDRAAQRRGSAHSTIGSSRRSTTTSTSRRRSPSSRAILRSDVPADERRWLVLDADAILGLDLDRVWEPSARRRVPVAARRDRARWSSALPPETHVTTRAPTSSASDIEALGWAVVDGPDGPLVTRL